MPTFLLVFLEVLLVILKVLLIILLVILALISVGLLIGWLVSMVKFLLLIVEAIAYGGLVDLFKKDSSKRGREKYYTKAKDENESDDADEKLDYLEAYKKSVYDTTLHMKPNVLDLFGGSEYCRTCKHYNGHTGWCELYNTDTDSLDHCVSWSK